MRKTKFVAIVLLLALFIPFLQGCGPKATGENGQGKEPEKPTEIHIGVYEPMTGASASGGQMTWEGIQLANEMHPEVLGQTVRLHLEDNKTDKTEAANAVTRLIDQKNVVAIIGSYGSSLSIAGGEVAKNKEIPVVGCSPTNPLVTQDNPYYFRVCFIDPFQGKVMAKYASENLNAKTAVIIRNVQDDYAVGLANYFKEAFIQLTGDDKCVLAELEYNTGDQDFTAQLTQTASLAPDVVFAPGNYGDSALMIRQARSLKITAPFLGGDTWEAPEFIEIGGVDVEGATLSTHYSVQATGTDASKAFVDAYKAKYNKEPNAFAALGYDAYLMILDAIKRANSAEPAAIRDALAGTKDFKGVTGTITMDENRDANKSAVILQVKDGAFQYLTTVEPF
ncbi:MAG: ABC transporter substrate-binding protein [Bacillota bacterium]|jgi:branched-chain amino acid transport system substrate-binding protein|nr:ABC transporter substrate-binding protein [Candidatus Fermentithermobacillaceae bacterium]